MSTKSEEKEIKETPEIVEENMEKTAQEEVKEEVKEKKGFLKKGTNKEKARIEELEKK